MCMNDGRMNPEIERQNRDSLFCIANTDSGCYGEERAESEDEAPVTLCSLPHSWPFALESDGKQVAEMSFIHMVTRLKP